MPLLASSFPNRGRKRGDMMTCASRKPPLPDDATGVYDKCLLHDPASIRAQLQLLIDNR